MIREYRNVFLEAGYSEAEITDRLDRAVRTFFYGSETERIYHEAVIPEGTGRISLLSDDVSPDCLEAGYLEDTGNHDARTEGMSYGMMLCVQLDMPKEFERIWTWARTYMYMDEGENEGYFAWSCAPDGTKNAPGPAPDGEEYFAMALFFAAHRWDIPRYESEARAILRACLHKGENGRPGHAMWNRENGLILFVPGSSFTDPSYHLPHFYELFALWADEEDRDFWKKAADESRKFLVKACHPVTGLNSEYSFFDGRPMDEPMPWGEFHHFYSDAYRTAANIGLDAEWFGRGVHTDAPIRQMRFLGSGLEGARCVYEVDGTPLEKTVLHPLGLLAGTAQGALCVPQEKQPAPDSDWGIALHFVRSFFEEPPRTGERRYYDNCLYLFASLALSGRYRIW